jgi:hypothetical protein
MIEKSIELAKQRIWRLGKRGEPASRGADRRRHGRERTEGS